MQYNINLKLNFYECCKIKGELLHVFMQCSSAPYCCLTSVSLSTMTYQHCIYDEMFISAN